VLALSFGWQMATGWIADRRRLLAEDSRGRGDRGEILQTVVIIGLFVAAAIVIVGIIVAKATNAANSVQTQ
jgi:hypothetical protein